MSLHIRKILRKNKWSEISHMQFCTYGYTLPSFLVRAEFIAIRTHFFANFTCHFVKNGLVSRMNKEFFA